MRCVITPQLFKYALEYAITKAQEGQVGMKLNGIHQRLSFWHMLMMPVCCKITVASNDVGLEIKIANRSFENVCSSYVWDWQ
jgi:hypothetical protein